MYNATAMELSCVYEKGYIGLLEGIDILNQLALRNYLMSLVVASCSSSTLACAYYPRLS